MEKLNNLLIVTGISGSGKDFLLSEVVNNNPELTSKISIYSFGQELFKVLKEKGVNGDLQNRDQLKELGDQKLMQLAITQTVNYILTTLPAIINTHIAYKQNNSIQINPNIDRLLRAK